MNKSNEILFKTAQDLGLDPKLLTEYGFFEINYNGKPIYFFNGTSHLNNALSSYLAKNKHITRVVLGENGLPNIPYLLPNNIQEAIGFLKQHGKIMIKPTHGDNSIGVMQINREEELKDLDLSDSLLEKFISGEEFRTLVLNGEVIAFHKYIHDFKAGGVRRISIEQKDWDLEMVKIAKKAAGALGLNFASVDFIKDSEGNLFVLEINSSTGLWRFHEPDEGPVVDVSRLLIEATLDKLSYT